LLNTAGADHANKREDWDEQLYRQFCDSTSTISSGMAQCRENMCAGILEFVLLPSRWREPDDRPQFVWDKCMRGMPFDAVRLLVENAGKLVLEDAFMEPV
jgi:hypothetical protein